MGTLKKLAIIDMDKISASILNEYLHDKFDCKFYSSSEELLQNFKKDKCDAIACDAFNSGEDARTVCLEMGEKLSIVFLSSMSSDEERRTCFLDEKHQYITKPFSAQEVQKAVNESLTKSLLVA